MSASCSCEAVAVPEFRAIVKLESNWLLMDPEVTGIEFRARANSRDSRALWAAAKAGHADVCKLLMDPAVAGIEFRAIVEQVFIHYPQTFQQCVQFAQAKISLRESNNSRCSINIWIMRHEMDY